MRWWTVETLMRYIRIFSDLSSQIRYSTQKRVLVEIALIKLCRPAMETNLDSVLDRLRVLEQRMDERPAQQAAVQQGSSGAVSGGVDAGMAAPKAAAPVKAAPEKICRRFVASWRVIVGQTSGIFKQMLQKAIPKYNGETGEPVLYVEFQDFLGKTSRGQSRSRESAEIHHCGADWQIRGTENGSGKRAPPHQSCPGNSRPGDPGEYPYGCSGGRRFRMIRKNKKYRGTGQICPGRTSVWKY